MQDGNDPRRLLVAALSVLSQLISRYEPFPKDVQLLQLNAQGKESVLNLRDLASSIILRETRKA